MKFLKTCLLLGLALTVTAEMTLATAPDQVAAFLDAHDDDLGGLFFYDSTVDDDNNIIESITSLLVGPDVEPGSSIDTIMKISEDVDLLGIDISHGPFSDLVENYEIEKEPFLIVFNDGMAAIKEEPTE